MGGQGSFSIPQIPQKGTSALDQKTLKYQELATVSWLGLPLKKELCVITEHNKKDGGDLTSFWYGYCGPTP